MSRTVRQDDIFLREARLAGPLSTATGLVGVPVLKHGDEREAYLFDDCRGASAGEGALSGGEARRECPFVEDVGYPAGEVAAGAVVPQDALVAGCELSFQVGEVGGDGSGGSAGLGAEVEPAGGLNACLVVFVLVAQVSG